MADAFAVVGHAVEPRRGRDESRRPEALLRRVAEIDHLGHEVGRASVGADHTHLHALERADLAGDLEVAVLVAMVAKKETDVHDVIGLNQPRRGLQPGVVGMGGRGGRDDEQHGKQSGPPGLPLPSRRTFAPSTNPPTADRCPLSFAHSMLAALRHPGCACQQGRLEWQGQPLTIRNTTLSLERIRSTHERNSCLRNRQSPARRR